MYIEFKNDIEINESSVFMNNQVRFSGGIIFAYSDNSITMQAIFSNTVSNSSGGYLLMILFMCIGCFYLMENNLINILSNSKFESNSAINGNIFFVETLNEIILDPDISFYNLTCVFGCI